MSPLESSEQLDRYFEGKDWMRSLARSLVKDGEQAEDVVQDTWLAALRAGADRSPPPASWLARVVRNLALRVHRTESRRERRERACARTCEITVTPQSLLERAELQRKVAGAVVALSEPYRSTILQRFFEDLSVKTIAERAGVPEATVRTRLSRGLHHLRRRLDVEYEGVRPQWVGVLLPVLGLSGFPSEAVVAGSAAAGSATVGTGASLVGSLGAIGGMAMTQKMIVSTAALGVASLLVGLTIGHVMTRRGPDEQELATNYVERGVHDEALERNERLSARLASLEEKYDASVTASSKIESEFSELASRLVAAQKRLDEEATPVEDLKTCPVQFGKWAELDAIRNTDWNEMAGTVETMNGLLAEVVRGMQEGNPPSVELQQKIAEANAKLIRYYGTIAGQIPTNSPINGEFSHPITAANVLAAMLERGGQPLTEEQKTGLAALGTNFDEEFEFARKSYDEDTPRLVKIINELELKRDCFDTMHEILTDEQRTIVVQPELYKKVQFDVMSPGTMATLIAQSTELSSKEELPGRLKAIFKNDLELDVESNEAAGAIVDRLARDLEPMLEKPKGKFELIPLDDAVTAGRVQANAVTALLQLPDLSEKTRTQLQSLAGWRVPRVVEPEKKGDE